eukprot:1696670-Rhodomonas_salina.2
MHIHTRAPNKGCHPQTHAPSVHAQTPVAATHIAIHRILAASQREKIPDEAATRLYGASRLIGCLSIACD